VGSHSIGPGEDIVPIKTGGTVSRKTAPSQGAATLYGGGLKMHFGQTQGLGPGMKILGLKTVANKLPES